MTDLTNDQHADTTVVAPVQNKSELRELARKAIGQFDWTRATSDNDKIVPKKVCSVTLPFKDGLLEAIIEVVKANMTDEQKRVFTAPLSFPPGAIVKLPDPNLISLSYEVADKNDPTSRDMVYALNVPENLQEIFTATQAKVRGQGRAQ